MLANLDLDRLFPNSRRVEIGPELHLSGMWGDADLLLGSCLVEIKTGLVDGGLSRATIEQLVGYVLLAAIAGSPPITEVAVLFGRDRRSDGNGGLETV